MKTIHAIPDCCGDNLIVVRLNKAAGYMTAEERQQAAVKEWNKTLKNKKKA